MSQRSRETGETDEQEQPEAVPEDPAGDETVVEDPGSSVGQVLGQSVPIRREVAEAAPGSPETGGVRTEDGRPSAEKPYT